MPRRVASLHTHDRRRRAQARASTTEDQVSYSFQARCNAWLWSLPPAEIGTAQQENPVKYINLPRAQREIVLRTWRTTLLYPLPKEVVTELIQLALSKYN